eukprot:COSAG05_NODE_785_length_7361_cov_460.024397_5_plen_151_part_00
MQKQTKKYTTARERRLQRRTTRANSNLDSDIGASAAADVPDPQDGEAPPDPVRSVEKSVGQSRNSPRSYLDEMRQQSKANVVHNAPRGKKGKAKKLKGKYADQDEDERNLRMELLGHKKKVIPPAVLDTAKQAGQKQAWSQVRPLCAIGS